MKDIVVGMGEALWDVLPEGKKIGGAPANFAYHAAQFGLRSCVVSAVGNDDLGREILDTLTEKGLNYLIEMVDYPTGTVQVELDGAGIPKYDIKEDTAWDNIPYTPELRELAGKARAVCFGSLAQRSETSRNTINHFLDDMPEDEGRLVVFDVNLRQNFYTKEILSRSMRRCDVLKINDEEITEVSRLFGIPGSDFEEISRRLLERFNLKMLILTCGVKGSYVFTPDGASFQPTPKVNVADTVGAGDSFTASFISAILKGKSVAEAHALAVETSAFVCTQKGAMPVLPERIIGRLRS